MEKEKHSGKLRTALKITNMLRLLHSLSSYAADIAKTSFNFIKPISKVLKSLPGIDLLGSIVSYGLGAFSGKNKHRPRRLTIALLGTAALVAVVAVPGAAMIAGLAFAATTIAEAGWRSFRLYKRWQRSKELAELGKELFEENDQKNNESIESIVNEVHNPHSQNNKKININDSETNTSDPSKDHNKKNENKNIDKMSSNLKRFKKLVEKSYFKGSSLQDLDKYEKHCQHKFYSKSLQFISAIGLTLGVVLATVIPPVGIAVTLVFMATHLTNQFIYKRWNKENNLVADSTQNTTEKEVAVEDEIDNKPQKESSFVKDGTENITEKEDIIRTENNPYVDAGDLNTVPPANLVIAAYRSQTPNLAAAATSERWDRLASLSNTDSSPHIDHKQSDTHTWKEEKPGNSESHHPSNLLSTASSHRERSNSNNKSCNDEEELNNYSESSQLNNS